MASTSQQMVGQQFQSGLPPAVDTTIAAASGNTVSGDQLPVKEEPKPKNITVSVPTNASTRTVTTAFTAGTAGMRLTDAELQLLADVSTSSSDSDADVIIDSITDVSSVAPMDMGGKNGIVTYDYK